MNKTKPTTFQQIRKVPGSILLVLLLTMLFAVSAQASVTQKALEDKAISFSWDAPYVGSSYTLNNYKVYVRKYAAGEDYKLYQTLSPSQTSTKITGLAVGSKYDIKVAYTETSNSTGSSYEYTAGYLTGKTRVAQVTGVKQDKWWYFVLSFNVSFDKQDGSDGYEYVCLKSNGKKQAKGTLESYSNSVSVSKIKNEIIYSFKIRAYQTFNGSKVYGAWSTPIYCFTQPRITALQVKGSSLNVKWKKVSGATGYAIYVSTKQKSGYKKVKTVSAKKASVTLKKFKGKKFNKKKHYYVYVQTLKKSGKKTNTSGALYFWDSKKSVGSFGYLT